MESVSACVKRRVTGIGNAPEVLGPDEHTPPFPRGALTGRRAITRAWRSPHRTHGQVQRESASQGAVEVAV